jgi:hypothetical protein
LVLISVYYRGIYYLIHEIMADLENKTENQNPLATEPTQAVATKSETPAQPPVAEPTPERVVQAPIVKKSPGKGKRLSPVTLAI